MSNFITEINIKKVRHLENIDIVLGDEKKHLILTGKNGCGKSSVLESLNTSLFPKLSLVSVHGALLTFNGISSTFNMEYKFNNTKIDSEFIYAFFKVKRGIDTYQPKGVKKIDLLEKKTEKLNNNFLQYIVNLKVEYLFAQLDNDIEAIAKLNIWFNRFEDILKQIFHDDSFKMIFDRKNYNFWIERENRERFDLNSLSDGYSAIIDIVTELILKIENTESKSFDCEGMVLIDEVDNHLHVELQKNILPLLTSFFPNIQFIVTTHSPFVLSSLENTVIYDLEKQIRVEDLSGYSYDSLIESYFDSDKYSKEVKEKIEIFEKLADRDDLSDSEKDEYYKLKKYFDSLPTFMSDELAVKLNEIKLRNMFKAG
jgi:predicted ATP-binding protein involved in virulence